MKYDIPVVVERATNAYKVAPVTCMRIHSLDQLSQRCDELDKFNLVMKHIDAAFHYLAELDIIEREEPREVLVRAPEYKKLRARRHA